MPTVRHSPNGTQTLTIHWSSLADRAPESLVLAAGETVSASTWTVPSGLTAGTATSGTDSSSISISGGTAGVTYDVVCLITTSAGRAIEQTIFVETEVT